MRAGVRCVAGLLCVDAGVGFYVSWHTLADCGVGVPVRVAPAVLPASRRCHFRISPNGNGILMVRKLPPFLLEVTELLLRGLEESKQPCGTCAHSTGGGPLSFLRPFEFPEAKPAGW